MKRIILAALMVVCCLAASAQIWVGGSLGFEYSRHGIDKYSFGGFNKCYTWSVAPEVGYVLSDKWAVGLDLSGGYKHLNTLYVTSSYGWDGEVFEEQWYRKNTTSISVEPFVRWSFFRKGIVTLFVDGALGYSYQMDSYDNAFFQYENSETVNSNLADGYYKEEGHIVSVGFRPGIRLDLTQHLSLQAYAGSLGYCHTFGLSGADLDDDYKSDHFGLAVNQTPLYFGLTWRF